ncbi:MAG: hypothetical protein WDZ34_00890 [Candidatus Saccharimonadales bacterium]
MEIKAKNFRQKRVISKRRWDGIPFDKAAAPMKMAFTEVSTKNAYQMNFKEMFNLFIHFALTADAGLDAKKTQQLIDLLYDDLSDIKFLDKTHKMTNEYCMLQAATLYALICTQDKGANIQKRLMKGKNNHAGSNMYIQQRTDREYFELMNKEYPNFCTLVSLLEPRKSNLIEVVAGYLLTE